MTLPAVDESEEIDLKLRELDSIFCGLKRIGEGTGLTHKLDACIHSCNVSDQAPLALYTKRNALPAQETTWP